MSGVSTEEFAKKIGAGLLSFPVAHFTDDFAFDEHGYREHIDWLLGYKPAGLFAAGGTGELFSLTLGGFSKGVVAAGGPAKRPGPGVAGCGYGAGVGKQFARGGRAAGAGGSFLLP